ncbi:MAG: alpha/beta fold hydrolase [Vicinamibacterales bacterium]
MTRRHHGRRVAGLLLSATLLLARPGDAAPLAVQLHTSDGIGLAAALYDVPDAPAVVLVPMYTRTKDDWRAFAERLQAAGIASLAIDLRGHGGSAGPSGPSPSMALDVRAAVDFLAARSGVRAVGIVGASLGANVALLAAAEATLVRGVALISPASDYRGVRIDAAVRKYGARPMYLVASTEDPLAARTVRGLVAEGLPSREQRLSLVTAHGTLVLERDPDVAAALVDWLRRTLLS